MIKEIFEENFPDNKPVQFIYSSTKYYDIIKKLSKEEGWIFELKIKDFQKPFKKKEVVQLFNDYKENTRYFEYLNQNGHEIGVIAVGHQKWNNLCRVWDIYVQNSFQNLGIGTELMKHAEMLAKEWSCRAIILEVQSCNYPAIKFYMKNGFTLSGFDLINYTNDDMKNHEVRLEMSKLLE